MRHSGDIKRFVKGFMIESYIEDGNQKIETAFTANQSPIPASVGIKHAI